jgi:3-hydroxybutyryl-CoA dehydratase
LNSYVFEDLKIGFNASFDVEVIKEMVDGFVTLSGDNNPLHTDIDYAKKHEYPDVVVHGMLTSSFYSRLVGLYLPGKYCILQEIKTSFISPVHIGDTLTVYGEIDYINYAMRQVEIKANILGYDGKKVSRARIKVGVLDER